MTRARLLSLALGVLVMCMWGVSSLNAAEPSPVVIAPGDPRSEGEGPGIVGGPLEALAMVVALGVFVSTATYVWLRVVQQRGR